MIQGKSGVGVFFVLFLCNITTSIGLVLNGNTHSATSVTGQTVTMEGHSELHLSGGGSPLSGSIVHLNSEDAWVFFHAIKPSEVISGQLSRLRVNGAAAIDGATVRVVQHAQGTVVIPHGADYRPLRVYTAQNFTGHSRSLRPHTLYKNEELGVYGNAIRSFILKRGWMVTFADNESGTDSSRVYIAQDSDLEVPVLASSLDKRISFVRVMPWRWVNKKGTCDTSPDALNAQWHYNWNISLNSTPNWEYVAIKQQPYWPGLNQNWEARGVNHVSGFNEPDNPVEDAYKNLTPQGSATNAAERWPELLGTGLRVGAPAVTDGGLGWLNTFMSEANARGYRVDYVPVHYYRSYWNKSDAQGAANQMYQFLKSVHDATGLPVWVTEFNNGANWTDNAHDPSTGQNRDAVQKMIEMMDSTPWVERYAVYSRVEWFRQTHYDDGGITPMGAMYRDHESPIGHLQEVSNTSKTGIASYLFEGNTRDSSGNGNVSLTYGTPSYVPGVQGQAISLDGEHDYLKLTPRFGDSSDFTFAAWVKWNGGGNWQRIIDFGSGTDRYLFLTPKSGSNTLRFAIKNGGSEQILETAALGVGEWTHVGVTISGNTGRLFVNGSIVDTNTGMTINPSELGTENNYLGNSQFSADPLFNGALDDVRIFNYARSVGTVAGFAQSNRPVFSESLEAGMAKVNLAFVGSLAGEVNGGVGSLRFEKIDGPGWLSLGADGSYSGVPGLKDAGKVEMLVRVTDTNGNVDSVFWEVEVQAPDPVARLSFESNADDSLGNAHGELGGGASYTNGNFGQALHFDGVDDHLILPEGVASNDEITVACWVRWDGGDAWQRVFDFGNGTDSYLMLTPRSSGNRIQFAIKNGGASEVIETAQLASGAWKHLAVTLSEGVGRLYVDGLLAGTNSSMTIKPSDIRPQLNYLGKSQWPDPYFDGRLDEFQVFPRALSQSEINDLLNGEGPAFQSLSLSFPPVNPGEDFMAWLGGEVSGGVAPYQFAKIAGPVWLTVDENGRMSGVPGEEDSGDQEFRIQVTDSMGMSTAIPVSMSVNPPTGLVAHYQFRGDLVDGIGSNNGVPSGGPGYAEGWYDEGVDLDGDDDYVQLPAGMVSSLNDVTFATRFRWDGGGSWQRVFDFGNNTTQYLFLTPGSSAGTLRFGITINGSGGTQFLETDRPRGGEWIHVAVTLAGNVGTLYVNGVEADSGTITLNPSNVAPTKNYLGESQWPDPRFDGLIDDFRIYNRALTEQEVKSLAVPPEPTVVVLPYDLWAAEHPFGPGESLWTVDADGDGSANIFEWIFGTDPLDGGSFYQMIPRIVPDTEVGLADGEQYFLVEARVRKERLGFSLFPEGSVNLEIFSAAPFDSAGTPVDDGEFEILKWYVRVPVSALDRVYARMKIVPE